MRPGSWLVAGVAATALVTAPASWAGDQKPPEQTATEPPDKAKDGQGPDGFVIQSGDSDFRIRIGGYAQADGRFFADHGEGTATNTFLVRRARLVLQGTVARYFDFYIDPDFGLGQTVLFDAYLNVRPSSKLQFRIGKFKSPVGLERLQSGQNILLAERALPTALVPNRDVGAEVHGELAGGIASYALGVFDGALDGALVDIDTNDGKDLAGRLFLQPFARGASALKGLGLGVSGTRGRQQGALPSFRSGGQLVFFSYLSSASADGNRTRISPQFSFYRGPVGAFGEYVRSRQAVRNGAGVTPVSNEAWEVTASVLLTGETATAGVRPRRSFDPSKGTWGALELAVRANRLTVDGAAFSHGLADPTKSARGARAWAIGLNWYLNRNVKYMVDFERTTFTGGAAGGNRPAENAILVRSQVAF